MYKLFLTFRYLTRKKIVLFPILVVWLCVMMLIIVSSIMGGFITRVRETNHAVYGDIIISGQSFSLGFPYYDEIRKGLETSFPQIVASTPEVEAYGLIYVPAPYNDSRPARLVGINVAEQMKVTKFRESLFNQYNARIQAINDLAKELPADRAKLIAAAQNALQAASAELDAVGAQTRVMQDKLDHELPTHAPNLRWLWGLIPWALLGAAFILLARRRRSGSGMFFAIVFIVVGAGILTLGMFWPVLFPREFALLEDRAQRADDGFLQAERTLDFVEALPAQGSYPTRRDLEAALVPPIPSFDVPPDKTLAPPKGLGLPPDGAIVGAQLGFFKRDKRGIFLRPAQPLWQKVVVSVAPANARGQVGANLERAVSHAFTIVDDSHTGQFDVDLASVYAPLEIVQEMAGLRADPEIVKENPAADFPPRCQQILLRTRDGMSNDQLLALCIKIRQWIEAFAADHPESQRYPTYVQTWEEKQQHYLDAVGMEKKMIVFILGLMSLVVIVVIFLIFYQIVRDKTRDIGIIKAVGGSEEGVAGIFLIYGIFVGLIGGGLGILTGVEFVIHTNQIHEWIFQMTGIVIWDRSVYIFDHIPDQVNPREVAIYSIVALVAGMLGALIPAIFAGAKDPVQAVRYE